MRFVTALLLAWLIATVPIGASFTHCRTITFNNHPSSTLTDFPVVIQESALAYLKSAINGGQVQNTVTQTGGGDTATSFPADVWVVKNASDCTGTKASWEWEYWDATTGDITLWVKVASLASGADTVYLLCYNDVSATTWSGNVTDVWSNSFGAVYHFGIGGSASGAWKDSTSGAHNGTGNPNNANRPVVLSKANSKLGIGLQNDGFVGGLDQYVDLARFGTLSGGGNVTITLWAYHTHAYDSSIQEQLIEASDGSTPEFTGFLQYNNGNTYTGFNGGPPDDRIVTTASATWWPTTTWTMYGFTNNGTSTSYINSVAQTPTVSSVTTQNPANNLTVGGNPSVGRDHVGREDELQISSVVRAAAWLTATYTNQNNPSGYYTIGAEGSSCGGGGATNAVPSNLPRLGARNQ